MISVSEINFSPKDIFKLDDAKQVHEKSFQIWLLVLTNAQFLDKFWTIILFFAVSFQMIMVQTGDEGWLRHRFFSLGGLFNSRKEAAASAFTKMSLLSAPFLHLMFVACWTTSEAAVVFFRGCNQDFKFDIMSQNLFLFLPKN